MTSDLFPGEFRAAPKRSFCLLMHIANVIVDYAI